MAWFHCCLSSQSVCVVSDCVTKTEREDEGTRQRVAWLGSVCVVSDWRIFALINHKIDNNTVRETWRQSIMSSSVSLNYNIIFGFGYFLPQFLFITKIWKTKSGRSRLQCVVKYKKARVIFLSCFISSLFYFKLFLLLNFLLKCFRLQ